MIIQVTQDFFENCRKTYSADIICSGEKRVRGVVEFRGKQYVCTGNMYSKSPECYLSEILPAELFSGVPHFYEAHDWEKERNYHGIQFKRRGSWWVFTRNKITLVPNQAPPVPNTQASLLAFA